MRFIKGQSLIEVLVAFGVTVVLGVGLISAALVTMRSAASARNNTQAAKLADEYIEQVRVIRDVKGYAYFSTFEGCNTISATSSDPGTWTLLRFITGVPASGGCAANLTDGENIVLNKVSFYRDVEIPVDSSRTRIIKVTVSWTEGASTRTVNLQTTLSSWCEGAITTSGAACP